MARYLFDCEGDGLLPALTTLHCLALTNIDTGEELSFADQPEHRPIIKGLKLLEQAEMVVGHNIIGYDLLAIEKIYPWFKRPAKLLDTLVAIRLIFPDLFPSDQKLVAEKRLPGHLQGSHSLEAWGWRLGTRKGDFGAGKAQDDAERWSKWTPEMHSYMVQDVRVNLKLLETIRKRGVPPVALKLEQEARALCSRIEQNGMPFDRQQAEALSLELRSQQITAEEILADAVGTVWVKKGPEFTPKVTNVKRCIEAGVPFTRVAAARFNPGSRQMMTKVLIARHGWQPSEFTAGGQPKLDDEIIETVPLPGNLKAAFRTYLLIGKRLGQLTEGKNAWLKLEKAGVIHAGYNTQGAITGRCTHNSPNIAQVPRVGTYLGEESRGLFKAPPGWVMVGSDLSGIELRMLAHELYRYDLGEYREIVLTGDVHTTNQQAAGLPTRAAAKTFIFGFVYGAGDFLIGQLVAPKDATEAKNLLAAHKGKVARVSTKLAQDLGRSPTQTEVATAIKGRLVKERFLRSIPALKALREDLIEKAQTDGFIVGLDGRKIPIRSAHSVLNFTLQGGAAQVCKKWLLLTEELLLQQGLRHGWDGDFTVNGFVHDEQVLCCRPGLEETLKKASLAAAAKAGEFFKLNLPIAAEAKHGASWREVH